MTGRGTPRVQPQGGKPSFFPDGVSVPAQGAWGYTIVNTNNQLLTNSYALYTGSGGVFDFDLPYGATRVGVIGLYTPAENGGRLGLQVRWFTGQGLAYALLVKDTSAVSSADPEVIEVESFGAAVITPPAAVPVLTPNRYVIPFVVPPLASPVPTDDVNGQTMVRMRIYVCEAGGGAAGNFALERIVAESFGEAQPFTQR